MLEDKHVYLAFYPHKNWDNGALFSTLAIPNIAALIVEAPGQTAARPRYVLRDNVCKAWAELENFLLNAIVLSNAMAFLTVLILDGTRICNCM